MDLSKTGTFIAERRKALNLTQVQLSIKLGVSEKTISKWECGKGFPDTSLILPLCKILNISANELLSGKKLSDEEYKREAESNLLILKNKELKLTKLLLFAEILFSAIITIFTLGSIFLASFFLQNDIPLMISVDVISLVMLVITCLFSLQIEKDAGYYMCAKCNYKYIPTYKSVLMSMHTLRTRYMKCPKCHKRSWSKKVVSDE